MSAFYDDMAATAAELLDEFGQTAKVTWSASGDYDTSNGTAAAPDPVTQTGKAVELTSSRKAVNGVLVEAGDKMILLSPTAVDGLAMAEPDPDTSTILLGSTTWTVKAVEPLSPGGQAVAFTVLLRR